jgi:hypothetical protein
MRSSFILFVGTAVQCAALCGAFAPSARGALRRPTAASIVPRHAVRMDEEPTTLKFNAGPEGIEDAPVLDMEEAMEVAMGRAKGPDTPDDLPPLELRPVSELSDFERRERKRMEAVKKYAPWMADVVSPEAIAQREQAERDRANKKVVKLVGNRIDPAKQELSGSGLKIRVSNSGDTGNVDLEWSTGSEESNLGFIVSRKGPDDASFVDISDYERFQALRSKGAAGGTYTFTDEDVPAGAYMYKVQDVAVGSKALTEVCRRGVDVETQGAQSSTIALVAGFLGLCAVLYTVGNSLDPQ